jgi:hypothetical protein
MPDEAKTLSDFPEFFTLFAPFAPVRELREQQRYRQLPTVL